MKLNCQVEVNPRILPGCPCPKRKSQRGCISMARKTVKDNDVWLLLQTATNKQGTKYKIEKNIEKVFTKFVTEGKATIRIIEPPHDVHIKCESIQLKSFLHVLKLALSKKLDPAILNLSNLTPKTLTVQKTKVVITKKSEYPVLEGFPRTAEALYLTKLERKSFDRQILKLQSLRILDLSDNLIANLPDELGNLPNLSELYLGSNNLGSSVKWSWMNGTNIGKSLRLLDLSKNNMSVLPSQMRKLLSLVTLKLSDNSLSHLLPSIASLTSLRYLELQMNNLKSVPGSLVNLRLNHINVSSNPFDLIELSYDKTLGSFPNLVEIAARVVVNSRTYYDASIVPLTLVTYLDTALYCVCGKSCFASFVRKLLPMSLHRVSANFTTSNSSIIPFDCHFCSVKCMLRFAKY